MRLSGCGHNRGMKEELAFICKVFLTILCLGLTSAAATAFMVFVGAIAFVLPVNETLAWLLIYGAYAGSFALGVHWCRSIWKADNDQNIQNIASTVFAFIVPFFCAVVGAVICTYVGHRMPIQLPNIIADATLGNDRGQSTLMVIYPLMGIVAGLCFWLMIIHKEPR